MESQVFTVFANKDGFDVLFFASNAVEDRPQTLGGLIEYVVSKGAFPVAWAPEFSSNDRSNPGKRGKETVCAESLAAGRVIEFRDGKYIPLGVAEEAPKTAGQFYDEGWNAAHDGLPLDSKATRAWRDGWNDYQHADPAHKIRLDGELAAAVRECITPEPHRPALTWATPAPFDPWKGFFTEPADMADWQDTYFPR